MVCWRFSWTCCCWSNYGSPSWERSDRLVGETLGPSVGLAVVGPTMGTLVGKEVIGFADGCPVGEKLGPSLGLALGSSFGLRFEIPAILIPLTSSESPSLSTRELADPSDTMRAVSNSIKDEINFSFLSDQSSKLPVDFPIEGWGPR